MPLPPPVEVHEIRMSDKTNKFQYILGLTSQESMESKKYYVWSYPAEQSLGPYSQKEMGDLLISGKVSEASQIWFPGCVDSSGVKEWRPLSSVPELNALCHELPPQSGPKPSKSMTRTARPSYTQTNNAPYDSTKKEAASNFKSSESEQANPNPLLHHSKLASNNLKQTSVTRKTRPKRLLREETSLLGRVFLYDGQEYLSGGAFFLRLLFFNLLSLVFNFWSSSIIYPSEFEWIVIILTSVAITYFCLLSFLKRLRSLGSESFIYALFSFSAWLVWGAFLQLTRMPRGSGGNEFLDSLGGLGLVLWVYGLAGFINCWIIVFKNSRPQRARQPRNAIRHLELKNEAELANLKKEITQLLRSFLPDERHIFFLRKRQLPFKIKKQLAEINNGANREFLGCVMLDGKIELAEKYLSQPPDNTDCTLAWKELMRKKGSSIASISTMLE